MQNYYLEFGRPTERTQAENRINRLIQRTKLTPFIAAVGLSSAALYGASESPQVGATVSLLGTFTGVGVLVAERKNTESQIKKAVDTYAGTKDLNSRNFQTELTINREGTIEAHTRETEDPVANGELYAKQKNNLGGEIETGLGAPFITDWSELLKHDHLAAGDTTPKLIVIGAASITALGLAATYRSANSLKESASAQLDNIDHGLNFYNESEY